MLVETEVRQPGCEMPLRQEHAPRQRTTGHGTSGPTPVAQSLAFVTLGIIVGLCSIGAYMGV